VAAEKNTIDVEVKEHSLKLLFASLALFDLDFSKIAVVSVRRSWFDIGPERLPGVARTVGTLIGKARRYVSDVKAEVNRTTW
jgi:hypothetical protein